jgi:hypothetical protein
MMSLPIVAGSPLTLAVERSGGTLVLDYPRQPPGHTIVLLHGGSREIAGYLSALCDPRGGGRTEQGALTIAGMSPGRYSACSMDAAGFQAGAVPDRRRCVDGIVRAGSELLLHVPTPDATTP